MKLEIAIPTYNRSQALLGKDYFTTAKYILPESQRDDYLKVLPAKRMIVIPDEEDGSHPRKLNWILKNLPRPVMMIDDDVECLRLLEGRKAARDSGSDRFIKYHDVDKKLVQPILEHYTDLAAEWDCPMWGISTKQDGDERVMLEFFPFSLSAAITSPVCCHLEHDCLYDERLTTKADFDMALQLLRKYKKILRTNKFAYTFKHGSVNDGGLSEQRTLEEEIRNGQLIMDKWGSRIIKYNTKPETLSEILVPTLFNPPIKGA